MRKELDKMVGTDEAVGPDEHVAYLDEIRRRDRRARWGTRLRYLVMHVSWIIVLLAGAAIALVEVFGLSSWVAPLLGFVVVVFQGVDRIFERTARGALAMDVLRRGLEREQRLLLVGGGPYAIAEDRGSLFAARCEDLIAENDRTMVAYFAELAADADE
jgi:hypothetical protein